VHHTPTPSSTTTALLPNTVHTLNLVRRKASIAWCLFWSRTRTDMMGWPMLTRATLPWGFPKAPRIPVCRLQRAKKRTHQWGGSSQLGTTSQPQQQSSRGLCLSFLPICTGARKHLVDTGDVVGVHSHTHVELGLTNGVHEVLVAANAGSLEGLAGEL
jgi:hypothetical protein